MFGRVIGGNRYDNSGYIPTWHFFADDAASASCIPNGSTMSALSWRRYERDAGESDQKNPDIPESSFSFRYSNELS